MKKFVNAIGVMLACACTISLASCNSNSKVVKLQLTASRDADVLNNTATKLTPVMEKLMPGYTFKITTGTDFSADGVALASEQIDAAFMTASTFAQIEVARPGKVDMVLRSTRDGFKVIQDNPDASGNTTSAEARAKQLVAMNDGSYHGEAAGKASYYYAELIMKKSDVASFDTDGDGKVELYELAGKKIGMQGATSPAGYTYPLYTFSQEKGKDGSWTNGMKGVAQNPDASKGEFQMIQTGKYGAQFSDLMSGKLDAMWGYMDIRNDAFKGSFSGNGVAANDNNIWDGTYTVELTQPILNDGVAVRSSLDAAVRSGLVNAFKTAVATGDIHDNGTGNTADATGNYDVDGDGQPSPAYLIYSLYSHTGYEDAKNSDYDGEIEFYKWSQANLK